MKSLLHELKQFLMIFLISYVQPRVKLQPLKSVIIFFPFCFPTFRQTCVGTAHFVSCIIHLGVFDYGQLPLASILPVFPHRSSWLGWRNTSLASCQLLFTGLQKLQDLLCATLLGSQGTEMSRCPQRSPADSNHFFSVSQWEVTSFPPSQVSLKIVHLVCS